MPLSATEILASAGTGSYFSAVGTGADDGLTSQLLAWPAAGALELVAAGLLTAVVVGRVAYSSSKRRSRLLPRWSPLRSARAS